MAQTLRQCKKEKMFCCFAQCLELRCGVVFVSSTCWTGIRPEAMSMKPHPNKLFSLSLCGSLIILKSKFASGERKSGRNREHKNVLMTFGSWWHGDFASHLSEDLCTHTQLCPSIFQMKGTVVDYWWCVHLDLGLPKIQKNNPLMIRQLFHFCLRHRIQYTPVKCETPTDGWTDTFHFFVSISALLDKDSPPQQRRWDTRQSEIHYHNTVLDKWTLTCLSHNKLIVPHKVSILTASQTQLLFSLHTKTSVIFPVLEKSGRLICYIWQQSMTGEQSRYYCKIFQRRARIISLQIMWVLSYTE